jgi:hypothetical protein
MNAYLNLADNPLFVKHVRSRLRRGVVMPSIFVVCFFSLCIVWLDLSIFKADDAVGSHLFFWLQALILMLMGGSQVAAAVGYVKESGILDFHRVTPVPSSVQALGFLLGAPIREWILFGCTLPFALVCAIHGPWGLSGFTKVLLVQITGAFLYHAIGVVTGLAGRAKGASGRLVAIVVALNIGASNFSEEGIYGPTLLSPLPVYYDVAFGNPQPKAAMRAQRNPNRPGFNQPGPVPMNPGFPQLAKPDPHFFAASVPLVVQTLLFQSSIFVFLMIAAARRFRSSRMPLYSKRQALVFAAVLAFLTLGSLWESSGPTVILASAYFLTFTIFLLESTVTPAVGDVAKGLQRARRHGASVSVWSDLATNTVAVACFAAIVFAALAVAVIVAPMPNPANVRFEPWGPPAVAILAVLSYGWALQYFHLHYGRRAQSYFALFLFIVWVVPIVVGGLLMASGAKDAGVLMGASPIIGIAMSGELNLPLDPVLVHVVTIAPGAVFTLLFAALVRNEERRLAERVRKEHEVRTVEAYEAA